MLARFETLLKYLEESPGDAFLMFALAQEYAKRNEINLAIETYQSLVELHPTYVATYYHLGKLQVEIGKKEEAIRTYQAGIAIASKQGEHHAQSELQAALEVVTDA